MKRYLAIILGVILVVAMAATAYAEVTIGGDARVRGIWKNNYDLNDDVDDDARYYDQRVRIKIDAKVAGDAEVRTRFTLIEGTWGKDAGFNDANGTVRFDDDDYAYLHVPIGNITLDIGRQHADWGNKFLVWNASKNRIKLVSKVGTAAVGAAIDKNREDLAPNNDMDYDDYLLFFINQFGAFKVALLGVYFNDDKAGKDGQLLDLAINGSANGLNIAGELVFKWGDLMETTDKDGDQNNPWGGFLMVTKSMDNLTVGGAVAYTANGYVANKYFEPTVFFGTGNSRGVAMMNFGAGGGDTLGIVVPIRYKASGALTVGANLAYASFDEYAAGGLD